MITKSKKGEGEIQTLMYLFFAVIFIITGLISVKSYLINVDINKNLQLSNLDFGIIGNRMLASDNCLVEQSTVELFAHSDASYTVKFTQLGTIERNKIKDSATVLRCLEGFDKKIVCSNPQYSTESACILAGVCSDDEFTDEMSCESEGSCIPRFDITKKEECDMSETGTWVSENEWDSEENTWSEITIEKYGVSFYDLDENDKWKRARVGNTYGTLNCELSKRTGEFLINIKDDSGQTNLGVFKLCII